MLDLVPVPPGPARMVEIGGGHAGYSIGLCRRHPHLTATVVDLPAALAIGAHVRAIADAGLTDRIATREWDILGGQGVPGPPYEVVLLFKLVHGYQAPEAASLLHRAARAVAPGGTVALHEPLEDLCPPSRLFGYNGFHGQGGRAYPFTDLVRWLIDAGLTRVRRHRVAASPHDHLILATKAGR